MTNLERLQQRIAGSELDAVLLVNSDNRFFATGVAVQGKKLVMNIGYSHPVEIVPPAGIKLSVDASKNEIKVSGINKELVGQIAADIRAKKIPDPYHAYGVRYSDEEIVRKEGKTAGK